MIKKISFLMLFCVTLVCGCSKENNSQTEKEALKEKDSIVIKSEVYDNYYRKVNITCEEIKDIIDYSDGLFITNDGSLYKISFNKIFSDTNTNCQKVSTDIKFVKFIRSGLLDQNNNIYYFDNAKNTLELFTFAGGYTTMPYLNNISKQEYKNISSIIKPKDIIPIYFYYANNAIYKLKDDFITEKDIEPKMVFQLENNETISYIVDGTIKTNKTFYSYDRIITNEDECHKYADIECNYEDKYYQVDELNQYYDSLKFFKSGDNGIIVDNSQNVFLRGYLN